MPPTMQNSPTPTTPTTPQNAKRPQPHRHLPETPQSRALWAKLLAADGANDLPRMQKAVDDYVDYWTTYRAEQAVLRAAFLAQYSRPKSRRHATCTTP